MENPLTWIPSSWSRLVHSHSPVTVEFAGSILVQTVAFWLPVSFFTALDLLGPARVPWAKIQSSSKQPDIAAVKKGFANCLLNQFLTSAIHLSTLYLLQRFTTRTTIFAVEPTLPSWGVVLKHFTLCTVLQEIIFYHAHRTLHTPTLYRRIHKKHHEFTTPIALAALYAHPLEYIASNILPVVLPPVIVGAHITTFWVMLAGALAEAVISHSGYYLPPVLGWTMIVHDLHHELSGGNFGIIGLCDWVHGTRFTQGRVKIATK